MYVYAYVIPTYRKGLFFTVLYSLKVCLFPSINQTSIQRRTFYILNTFIWWYLNSYFIGPCLLLHGFVEWRAKEFGVANIFHKPCEVILFLQCAIFSSQESVVYQLNESMLATVLSLDPGFGPKMYCLSFGFPSIECIPQAQRAYPCISCGFFQSYPPVCL